MDLPIYSMNYLLIPHCGHGIVPGVLEQRKLNNLQFQFSVSYKQWRQKNYIENIINVI